MNLGQINKFGDEEEMGWEKFRTIVNGDSTQNETTGFKQYGGFSENGFYL
jgi:hypothetical protein